MTAILREYRRGNQKRARLSMLMPALWAVRPGRRFGELEIFKIDEILGPAAGRLGFDEA